MSLNQRIPSINDLLFGGFILALSSFILYNSLSLKDYLDIEVFLWVGAVIWCLWLLKRGFDPARIIYSFSWSFVSIIGFVYIVFIALLGITGFPRHFLFFILPVVVIAGIGYIGSKIAFLRVRRRGYRLKIPFKRRVTTALFKLDTLMIVFIIVSLAVLTLFLIIPVGLMFLHAFKVMPGEPWYSNFYYIFTRTRYVRRFFTPADRLWTVQPTAKGPIIKITGINYGILVNSLLNATVVASVATILGVIVAFILARYDFRGKTFFRILATVPLFITPFVNAYVIKLLFGPDGPISMITQALFGFRIMFTSLAGVALAQIMAFYPIVYLNAYSSFINIDPSMEEQAENLGARGLRLFFTVTLPLALPGIAAGSILVFIFSLEDLGAPIVFQERNLMSYQIFSSLIGEAGVVTPEIAALGIVLLGLAVVGFLTIRSYVGMRAYAMISRGGRWNPRIRRFSWKGHLIVYLFLLPLILFTAMPQIGVVLMAFNVLSIRGFTIQPEQATPKYVVEIFTGGSAFAREVPMHIRNTIVYALSAVLLAIIIAIITAYVVSRTRIKFVTPTLDTLATIPIAIPGLVVALGYYFFFSELARVTRGTLLEPVFSPLDPAGGPGVFQAWIILIIAYSIRKLPFVARAIYAGFQQVHEALEEAALNLGARRFKVLSSIVLPMIVTNIVSGALIGFIYISTEVSTSVTIGSFNSEQAPMTWYMMNIYKGGTTEGIQYVAAMGFLLIVFQLIAVTIVTLVLKQRYAFIGI